MTPTPFDLNSRKLVCDMQKAQKIALLLAVIMAAGTASTQLNEITRIHLKDLSQNQYQIVGDLGQPIGEVLRMRINVLHNKECISGNLASVVEIIAINDVQLRKPVQYCGYTLLEILQEDFDSMVGKTVDVIGHENLYTAGIPEGATKKVFGTKTKFGIYSGIVIARYSE